MNQRTPASNRRFGGDEVAWPVGWNVRHVDETGSTNDDLLQAAVRGEIVDRTVLMTGHQTAGRGRLDRRWDAPPGTNLLASIFLADVPETPADVMQRVGLAIVHAVDDVVTARDGADGGSVADAVGAIGLKWPNDVLVDGRKLAGVLAQRASGSEGVVVGFGVNVGWAPDGAARLDAVTSITPAELLARVLVAFDRLPDDHSDLYRERLVTTGQPVRVELPGGRVQRGRAVGVDAAGRLLVIDADGVEHCFDVGDVVHLRPGR